MASSPALNALGHAVSGSVGTAISTATLYPLDLVTTRLKAQKQLEGQVKYDGIVDAFRAIISREGGFSALYSGLGPDVFKSVVDSFLFFGFYNYLRRYTRGKPHFVKELALGALAGACSRAVTTPISNVVTRKQTSTDAETLREIVADIKKQGGLLGLWSGYSATLVLTLNPSITFFVNRRLATRIIPALEEEDFPVAWAAFLLAAISKATATAVTYPFQTAKTRLQLSSRSSDEKSEEAPKASEREARSVIRRLLRLLDRTIFGVVFRLIKNEGFCALYHGLQGELLKSFFSHGLTMFTKGVIHRLVIRLWFGLISQQRRGRLQTR
jgi:solute carrier family 25 (peroxisomal adenine nucleotide transporter), member 17